MSGRRVALQFQSPNGELPGSPPAAYDADSPPRARNFSPALLLFADIFANNCLKNGLLPVVLEEQEVTTIFQRARERNGYQVTVDLEQRLVCDSENFLTSFSIDDFQRECLIEGLDDVGLTLRTKLRLPPMKRSVKY